MAMELSCRIERNAESVCICLPMAQMGRAYMLLDALAGGLLRSFVLRDGAEPLECRFGAADRLDDAAVLLSGNSVACIKRMLLDVTLRPADAAWLHVDIEADGGDVSVRVLNE